jgi:hypothetical protein
MYHRGETEGWGMFTWRMRVMNSDLWRIFKIVQIILSFKNISPLWRWWLKKGWVNQDTGKKNEPDSICLVQYLQDVLETFAKRLIVLLNIKDLETEFIHKLGHLFFFDNKGRQSVSK